MGMIRICVDFQDVSHEVTFPIGEERNMMGEWFTDDYDALLASAVKSIRASIDAADGK